LRSYFYSKGVLHKASQQSVHLTLGILRQSQAVFYAGYFFWLDGFAVPAPAQVTQTVGRQSQRANAKPYLIRKVCFDDWRINSKLFLAVALFKVKYLVNIFSASKFSSSWRFRWRRFLRWHKFGLVLSSR
jgi:hypothetical protein